jgi:hypothetical protein
MKAVDAGLDLTMDAETMEFRYGKGVTGPAPEFRTLNAIRASLLDPECSGPSPVYSIAMDVHRPQRALPALRRCRVCSRTTREGTGAQPGTRSRHCSA